MAFQSECEAQNQHKNAVGLDPPSLPPPSLAVSLNSRQIFRPRGDRDERRAPAHPGATLPNKHNLMLLIWWVVPDGRARGERRDAEERSRHEERGRDVACGGGACRLYTQRETCIFQWMCSVAASSHRPTAQLQVSHWEWATGVVVLCAGRPLREDQWQRAMTDVGGQQI